MQTKNCFETIRIEDGIVSNLEYHNIRLNHTRASLFGSRDQIDLADYLGDVPSRGLIKAKIIYNDYILDITYTPYTPKQITHFKPLDTTIDYHYKYTDRTQLNLLTKNLDASTEIILIKHGLVTDTSIANIAIRQDTTWYTPKSPLLDGTTRARLLDDGFLTPRDITITDVLDADEFALMNAMIGFHTMPFQRSLS